MKFRGIAAGALTALLLCAVGQAGGTKAGGGAVSPLLLFPPHIVIPRIPHLRVVLPPRPKPKPDYCLPFRRAARSAEGHLRWKQPPRPAVRKGRLYSVTFRLEAPKGKKAATFTIVPDVAHAPRTANSFLFLACSGYFTGTSFDRVVPGRLIEGGAPVGPDGNGPGYTFPQEPVHGGYTRGTVVMAADGSANDGGRFVILLSDLTLPPAYTILGTVSSGLSAVDGVSRVSATTQPDAQEVTLPVQPVRIAAVSVSALAVRAGTRSVP